MSYQNIDPKLVLGESPEEIDSHEELDEPIAEGWTDKENEDWFKRAPPYA